MPRYRWWASPALDALLPSPGVADVGKHLVVEGDGGYGLGVTLTRRDIPIPFDKPGLYAGVDLFTPQADELFVNVWVTLETVWDGPVDNTTLVAALIGFSGDPYLDPAHTSGAILDGVNGAVPTAADTHGFLTSLNGVGLTGVAASAVAYRLRVLLLDSNTNADLGDPGSTQGALTFHVISIPPAA